MKKKPQPPARGTPPGYQQPPAARKPPPRKPPPRQPAPGPGAPPPGYQQPPPPRKPAKKKPPVKRKLALGEAVACCAAEALAASLRLTGWRVTDEDVLALYELTAESPDEGATILATLEAASEYGLAGVRPTRCLSSPSHAAPRPGVLILGVDLPGPHALCDDGTAWWSWGQPWDPANFPLAVIEEAWEVTWA